MEKIVIAAVGFSDKKSMREGVLKAAEENGFWLFEMAGSYDGLGRTVAAEIGAPFIICKDVNELCRSSNFLVADLRGGQGVKNMLMKFKAEGKHGYVFR